MQIVNVAPYGVNRGRAPKKRTCYFFLFSGANLRSLQTTHMKCAEHVDILAQIICAKFKNDTTKDNGYTKCMKTEKTIPKRISAVCISLLCYSTMSKLLPSIVRDTGSNLLVQ